MGPTRFRCARCSKREAIVSAVKGESGSSSPFRPSCALPSRALAPLAPKGPTARVESYGLSTPTIESRPCTTVRIRCCFRFQGCVTPWAHRRPVQILGSLQVLANYCPVLRSHTHSGLLSSPSEMAPLLRGLVLMCNNCSIYEVLGTLDIGRRHLASAAAISHHATPSYPCSLPHKQPGLVLRGSRLAEQYQSGRRPLQG